MDPRFRGDCAHMKADKIIIIDFGSQYTKLIARKVRDCHVYSEVVSCYNDLSGLNNDKCLKGIILSGGPASVYLKNSPILAKQILDYKVPILGICYGLHLLSHHFKGKVTSGKTREFGKTNIRRISKSPIFTGIENEFLFLRRKHPDHGSPGGLHWIRYRALHQFRQNHYPTN